MAKAVGVGVVGLGRISASHITGYAALDSAEVVALCDAQPERIADAVKRHGLEEALATTDFAEVLASDEVQAVSLALPDHLHHDFTLGAIAGGKHVLCEKPLAMNAAEAQEMLAAAEEAGIVHAVHMQRRYAPSVRYIRDLVAEGFLGELRHFRCRMSVHRISDPDVRLEWRLQAERGCYGVLGDLGAHALDLAHFTMGESAGEMVAAVALGAIFIKRRRLEDADGSGEVTAWDAINVANRYETGVLGSYQLSRFSPGYSGFEIDGQEASVAVRGDDPGGAIMVYERRPRDDQIPASEYAGREIPERYRDGQTLFGSFIDAILQGGEASPSFADGLRVARELDSIHEAAFSEAQHE
ncbi:MAG: Gfo/Idh/MocA family protein [Armatimonadota bacterium]